MQPESENMGEGLKLRASAGAHAKQRGLAGAIRTEQRSDRTGGEVQLGVPVEEAPGADSGENASDAE